MQRDERLGRTTVDIPQLLIMLAKNRRGLGASRPGRGGGGGCSLWPRMREARAVRPPCNVSLKTVLRGSYSN